jgi:hypothetical protein
MCFPPEYEPQNGPTELDDACFRARNGRYREKRREVFLFARRESDPMQFLALTRRFTETFSEADFAAVLPAEAEHARGLYARGIFRSINSRGDVPGAVIVLEAADAAEASAIVGGLPLAEKKMMDLLVVPLLPYRGFIG